MRTPTSRRTTWSPGRRLRVVLLATAFGSLFGLVFGFSSLNRPVLNAAVFYVLGAVVAAAVASLAVVAVRRGGAASAGRRQASTRHRT